MIICKQCHSVNVNSVVRKHKFDMGHRLLNYQGACRHAHGHEYHIEIFCEYSATNDLGLGIDFADIKKRLCTWLDENLDHGFACNPIDDSMLKLLYSEGNKVFVTKLGNPSAENISKEIFFVGEQLLNGSGLYLRKIKLFETVNCYVETTNLTDKERAVFANYY